MDATEARRRSSASSSPEFEFWPLHPNPAASPSCADELFAGGVLLPLPVLPPKPASSHARRSSNHGVPVPEPETELVEASILATVAPPTASITSPAPPATASTGGSKRWTDIFSKKTAEEKEKEKEKRSSGLFGLFGSKSKESVAEPSKSSSSKSKSKDVDEDDEDRKQRRRKHRSSTYGSDDDDAKSTVSSGSRTHRSEKKSSRSERGDDKDRGDRDDEKVHRSSLR